MLLGGCCGFADLWVKKAGSEFGLLRFGWPKSCLLSTRRVAGAAEEIGANGWDKDTLRSVYHRALTTHMCGRCLGG